jgi:putative ABC transport system permease protein
VRSPKRTATTANALLIGVFLVSLVTIAGTSIKDFAVAEINKLSSADYVIESTGGTVDPQLVQSVEQVPGVQQVVPFQRESVTIDGKPAAISSGDIAALQAISKLDVAQGSFDDLGPGTIAVLKAANADVGATVTVADAQGKATPLTVAVVLDMTIDALQMGSIVDQATFTEVVGERAPTVAFIDAKPGEQSDTKDRIQDLADLRPDITLTVGNSLGKLVGTVFDFLINAVNGLLLMSVAVALIGIINTLSLSILERRRELGLLRVIGMVDKRVRRMVRLESILISALGTVMGIVLGAFVGIGLILAIDRLSDAGISVSMPWLLLGVVLVLGIALGLIASIIPARRSTRLEVLDAIQAT